MLINSEKPVKHSQVIEMNIVLTKDSLFTFVRLKAKVIWTKRRLKSHHIAVAFQYLSPKKRAVLNQFIS